ncbi:MAG: restriction endonuclease [Cyanobacteria bacterium P01_E01_bin.42]
MFDVFDEEIEIQIKLGIANLYWYKRDLQDTWLRSGVPQEICNLLFSLKKDDEFLYTKRELMDLLYDRLKNLDYERKLEISRNFTRILIERESFPKCADNHRVEIAESCASRLREIYEQQKNKLEQEKIQKQKEQSRKQYKEEQKINYGLRTDVLNNKFIEIYKLEGSQRGYALENFFQDLMKFHSIPVEESFKIVGEQIDGAIKYDGKYYLIELKWQKKQTQLSDLASLTMKIDGKLDSRGLFISMNGFTDECVNSIIRGKTLKMMLLDGNHIAKVVSGIYSFQKLLDYSIKQASLKGNIYCSHNLD